MQQLINTVFNFFKTFYTSIQTYFTTQTQETTTLFNGWVQKQVLDGELISIGMNWGELIRIVLPMILTLFLIFLVFKVLCKLFTGKVRR